MNPKKLALLALIVVAVVAFFAVGGPRYLTLAEIKSRQAELTALAGQRPLLVAGGYFLVYVAVATLSLPGAALLTLLAGALFGVGWGTLIVSFASSIGATLAFLASRFLFRDALKARYMSQFAAIDRGFARDGPFYLFTLRLVPVMPFFVVNLLMGLTSIPVRTYYWVSQLGMLAGTIVYVNLGTQLARIDTLSGLLSPTLLGSLAALGVLPLAARKVLDAFAHRRLYAGFRRPRRFDRNLVVIGGGSAGLVTAYIGATVKASVTLVEQHRMGGDCLNTGCVPSKALIRTAKLLHQARHSRDYGIRSMQAEVDFAEVMERVARVIRQVEPHDSVERYSALGVDCVSGRATVLSPWEVAIDCPRADGQGTERRTLTTRNIVIAAGARPLVPPIPGLADVGYLTSDTLWSLRTLPRRLVVLGGGPIGCELAQAFARLGARVVLVEMAGALLGREDPEVSQFVLDRFVAEGIDVRLGHRAVRFERHGDTRSLLAQHEGTETRIEFDGLAIALGRTANVDGYGLEALGVPITPNRPLPVDDYLRVKFPNVFACGDVAGPYQFTHTASHMAWYAAVNALFGRFRRFRVDYSVIPWCTFVDPEVATVGLNERAARERGIPYEVTRYGLDDLDRAIADSAAHGFVKVLTVPGKDRILGATIVGEHAGELITEFVSAMRHRLGLNRVLGTIHIYPTFAEANKYAAGEWKRAHAPAWVFDWLRRYHAWQRG